MTRRTVHLPVAEQDGIEDFVTIAQWAEELGYERVWLPETWGRDAVSVLSAVAHATDEIGIGTSIVNVYARSPALIAQTAVSLQELSDGRMRLGIGSSGPIVVEGWHGIEYERPLRRTREAIEIIRAAMSGEELDYDGDIFNLSGFRLRSDPPEELPAVDAAGMGPKAVELCGRFADGWHATVFTAEGLEERMADFHRGADLGDRDVSELRSTLSLNCAAMEDGERARDLARGHAAFYIGAMGTYYRESLARQGYEQEANEVAAAYASGDREQAYEAIDDDMLDAMAVAGTPERAREEMTKFDDVDGLDSIAVGFPRRATMDEIHSTLEALAP